MSFDDLDFITQLIIIFFVITFLMLLLGNFIVKTSCKNKANAIGYKYEYGFWQGCIIETPNGKRIPLEYLRYTEE